MFLNLSEETEEKINKLVEKQVLKNIGIITKDKEYINKLVTESMKGAIKSIISELLQSKNYRNILRNRIMEQLNLQNESEEE
jgi:hypothetical protein